jgi:hypothetical protein
MPESSCSAEVVPISGEAGGVQMADSGGGTPVTLLVPPSAIVPSPPGVPGVVVSPRPHLPFTGFDVTTALVLAALFLALGVLLIATGRRPTSKTRRT